MKRRRRPRRVPRRAPRRIAPPAWADEPEEAEQLHATAQGSKLAVIVGAMIVAPVVGVGAAGTFFIENQDWLTVLPTEVVVGWIILIVLVAAAFHVMGAREKLEPAGPAPRTAHEAMLAEALQIVTGEVVYRREHDGELFAGKERSVLVDVVDAHRVLRAGSTRPAPDLLTVVRLAVDEASFALARPGVFVSAVRAPGGYAFSLESIEPFGRGPVELPAREE